MTRVSFDHLLDRVGTLRHPCDLDLLRFFCRHPRALLTSDRLAAYVGYDLNDIERSLDLLASEGVVERSPSRTHAARLYVLQTPEPEWVQSVLDAASTRDGRQALIQWMKNSAEAQWTER
jgi:DNA-binding MarR family transcriptional regulator